MKKILLTLIACSSISLMGMDQKPNDISDKEQQQKEEQQQHEARLSAMLEARRERMLNDEEYKQLNAIPSNPAHKDNHGSTQK